jgi:hypothetical protein
MLIVTLADLDRPYKALKAHEQVSSILRIIFLANVLLLASLDNTQTALLVTVLPLVDSDENASQNAAPSQAQLAPESPPLVLSSQSPGTSANSTFDLMFGDALKAVPKPAAEAKQPLRVQLSLDKNRGLALSVNDTLLFDLPPFEMTLRNLPGLAAGSAGLPLEANGPPAEGCDFPRSNGVCALSVQAILQVIQDGETFSRTFHTPQVISPSASPVVARWRMRAIELLRILNIFVTIEHRLHIEIVTSNRQVKFGIVGELTSVSIVGKERSGISADSAPLPGQAQQHHGTPANFEMLSCDKESVWPYCLTAVKNAVKEVLLQTRQTVDCSIDEAGLWRIASWEQGLFAAVAPDV